MQPHRQERFRPNLPRPKAAKYWFPANGSRSWWAFPSSFAGRLVLVGHGIALSIAAVQLEPLVHPVDFGFAVLVLAGSLLAFCWRKGEPLRWMSSRPS
jgi:hypothetical protein